MLKNETFSLNPKDPQKGKNGKSYQHCGKKWRKVD